MFISTQKEIISLMPTARWYKADQLLGYLEEEERVALEPLLGTELYDYLCREYKRLTDTYVDITAATVTPLKKAKDDPGTATDDVTERLDCIQSGRFDQPAYVFPPEYDDVPDKDMITIRLIRICQQVEFYKMLSHKAGLLTVSFNEGGGMNVVTAEGYDPADDKRMERVVKDAFMSAGRAIDSLLLFLEADAKGDKVFTDLWQHADAFYLHRDLLFQTARLLNEYLDIRGERMVYVSLVRDIRFCQNTYLKPRIGLKLLKAVVAFANEGESSIDHSPLNIEHSDDSSDSGAMVNGQCSMFNDQAEVYDELLDLLRTALAFYVESRKTEIGPKQEKMARRDSMTDAQQAMAAACDFVEEHLDDLGDAVKDTPIYNKVRERERKEEWERKHREEAQERRQRERFHQQHKKLFTAFPATHRNNEVK